MVSTAKIIKYQIFKDVLAKENETFEKTCNVKSVISLRFKFTSDRDTKVLHMIYSDWNTGEHGFFLLHFIFANLQF